MLNRDMRRGRLLLRCRLNEGSAWRRAGASNIDEQDGQGDRFGIIFAPTYPQHPSSRAKARDPYRGRDKSSNIDEQDGQDDDVCAGSAFASSVMVIRAMTPPSPRDAGKSRAKHPQARCAGRDSMAGAVAPTALRRTSSRKTGTGYNLLNPDAHQPRNPKIRRRSL